MFSSLSTRATTPVAVEPSTASATLPTLSDAERLAFLDAARRPAAATLHDVGELGTILGGVAKLMEKAFSADPVGPSVKNP